MDGCVPEEDPDERDVESRANCCRAIGLALDTLFGRGAAGAGAGGGGAAGQGEAAAAAAGVAGVGAAAAGGRGGQGAGGSERDASYCGEPSKEGAELIRSKVGGLDRETLVYWLHEWNVSNTTCEFGLLLARLLLCTDLALQVKRGDPGLTLRQPAMHSLYVVQHGLRRASLAFVPHVCAARCCTACAPPWRTTPPTTAGTWAAGCGRRPWASWRGRRSWRRRGCRGGGTPRCCQVSGAVWGAELLGDVCWRRPGPPLAGTNPACYS